VLPCVPTAVTLALHETLEDDAKLAVALVAESGEIDVMESGLVPVQHWIESRLFAVVRLSEVRSIASEVVGPAAEADALAPVNTAWAQSRCFVNGFITHFAHWANAPWIENNKTHVAMIVFIFNNPLVLFAGGNGWLGYVYFHLLCLETMRCYRRLALRDAKHDVGFVCACWFRN